MKQELKKARAQLNEVVHNVVAPEFQRTVAQQAFSQNPEPVLQDRHLYIDGENILLPQRRNRDEFHVTASDCGATSFVHAQARAGAMFIDSARDAAAFLHGTSIMDDASMWLKDPKPPPEPLREDAQNPYRKGRNVHLPVLNVCPNLLLTKFQASDEHVESSSSSSSSTALRPFTRGADFECPAQPMPQANAATVHSHWKRWAPLGLGTTGRRIDPGG